MIRMTLLLQRHCKCQMNFCKIVIDSHFKYDLLLRIGGGAWTSTPINSKRCFLLLLLLLLSLNFIPRPSSTFLIPPTSPPPLPTFLTLISLSTHRRPACGGRGGGGRRTFCRYGNTLLNKYRRWQQQEQQYAGCTCPRTHRTNTVRLDRIRHGYQASRCKDDVG